MSFSVESTVKEEKATTEEEHKMYYRLLHCVTLIYGDNTFLRILFVFLFIDKKYRLSSITYHIRRTWLEIAMILYSINEQ